MNLAVEIVVVVILLVPLAVVTVGTWVGPRLHAQLPAWAELDTTRNNLEHAADYRTAALGSLGQVVRRGSGSRDVVLIAGWGYGADVFEGFMRSNQQRYRMVAVTLPGFAGTPAPPMPPAGTSYGERTWTAAAERALAELIVVERLDHPIIVGHFNVGAQIALRVALDHPDHVGGVVVVGGTLHAPFPSRRDSTGRTPVTPEERVAGVDRFWAPRWFKFVTEETWRRGNYQAEHYSVDRARGLARVEEADRVPLPVLIQYVCEYFASDLSQELSKLRVPVTALVPGFRPEVLADSALAMGAQAFAASWRPAAGHPRVNVVTVSGSGVFVMDDRPEELHRAVAELAGSRH